MSRNPVWQNQRKFSDRLYDARLGLPPGKVRPDWPIIFESKHIQDLLLRIARDGEVRAFGTMYFEPLTMSGLVTLRVTGPTGKFLALNPNFYAFGTLRKLLAEMNGVPCAPIPRKPGKTFEVKRLFGRKSFDQFAILRVAVEADGPLKRLEMLRYFRDQRQQGLTQNLGALCADGILTRTAPNTFELSKSLPKSFAAFVKATGTWLDSDGAHLLRPTRPVVRPKHRYVKPPAHLLRDPRDKNVPILFGNRRDQQLLLLIARNGSARVPSSVSLKALQKTGIVSITNQPARVVTFHTGHVAANEIRRCLAEIGKFPLATHRAPKQRAQPIWSVLPGNDGQTTFRVLHRIITTKERLDALTINRRLPDISRRMVSNALVRLVKQRTLVQERDGTFALAKHVPGSFVRFIVKTANWLAGDDPRITHPSAALGPKPRSASPSQDGAPCLFGSDLKLRNLMALARYGPMLTRELIRVTGSSLVPRESQKQAPFGRGGVVRRWETSAGSAVMLDPDYPLARELRRLLLRLESVYPLPPFISAYEPLPHPGPRPWVGDKYRLFGRSIPTHILLSIGVHGWTFQALCDAICVGEKLRNVMYAIRRLEREGVLEGDRSPGSGADVRVVTIAKDFPARKELMALIDAHVRVWPAMKNTVERQMLRLKPKTKEHLRRRGLWPYPVTWKPKQMTGRPSTRKRPVPSGTGL